MQAESDPFSPYRTDGKLYGFVCIVTGADKPIGAAVVAELAAHGAAVIYACHDSPSTPNFPDLDKNHPNTKIIDYPYSISSEHDTLVLIDEALNDWGRVDVWVCSSGVLGPISIDATTPQDLQKCFEANSLAPFFALKYAPHAMEKTTKKGTYPNAAPKDQKYGSIIVISSTASQSGGIWGPCYTMSSHAALGVVRAGVATLKGTGVRINCISPGQIDMTAGLQGADANWTTTQLPPQETQKALIGLERAGLPSEVGRVAGFLASGFSSYMTGGNLVVDGGSSVMNPLMVPT